MQHSIISGIVEFTCHGSIVFRTDRQSYSNNRLHLTRKYLLANRRNANSSKRTYKAETKQTCLPTFNCLFHPIFNIYTHQVYINREYTFAYNSGFSLVSCSFSLIPNILQYVRHIDSQITAATRTNSNKQQNESDHILSYSSCVSSL